MNRTRVSTTVDAELLDRARAASPAVTTAELIDDALLALVARYRAAKIDAAYASAYEAAPLDEPDEWGSLEEFRAAVGS
ncbi:MAG: DUF2191 domain-containing protein [Actinomycetota bacterium]|nr:DUF2191 domain-containing protein [Actinomycetota bacterium]